MCKIQVELDADSLVAREKRAVCIHVEEIQVHKRVEQIAGREAALFEHGKVVFNEAFQPLKFRG